MVQWASLYMHAYTLVQLFPQNVFLKVQLRDQSLCKLLKLSILMTRMVANLNFYQQKLVGINVRFNYILIIQSLINIKFSITYVVFE